MLCGVQRMLARQRKHVAVRRGLRDDASDDVETASRTSVHYLASQYLTDSSLNTDVSQFDFATSVSHSDTFINFVNIHALRLASLTLVQKRHSSCFLCILCCHSIDLCFIYACSLVTCCSSLYCS